MKAEHIVKVNGEWYKAGSEIPASAPVEKPTPVENKAEEPKEEKLTKSKIQLMNVNALREVCAKNGIENVDELTGSELKEKLIEKLGL